MTARLARGAGTLLLLVALLSAAPAEGEPWRALFVDAETNRPLEGVVVVLAWDRCSASVAGWVECRLWDAEEAVSGSDVRVSIPYRWSFTIPLVVRVKLSVIKIFKPGYGEWRGRESSEAGEVVHVIELPPLRTREERRAFISTFTRPGLVPVERIPRLNEAWMRERVFVGLER